MSELDEVRSELVLLRGMLEKLLAQKEERPRNYEYQEAARLLGVHPKTVSRMVASGELMPIRIRGKSLIPVSEIDRASAPPRITSSGATEEQTRFDGAKAMAELKALRKNKR